MDTQETFTGWAIVELFGHQRAVGFVTTIYFGTTALFRIDTPGLEEREFELTKPQWGDGQYLPKGAKVKRPATIARTKLHGPGAIYGITPCTEETARAAIEEIIAPPLILLELPKGKTPVLLPGETGFEERVNQDELGEEF